MQSSEWDFQRTNVFLKFRKMLFRISQLVAKGKKKTVPQSELSRAYRRTSLGRSGCKHPDSNSRSRCQCKAAGCS